jgi:drug/metabolite transporter (DMT)-like permease
VSRRQLGLLVLLAAIWGSSFMFIKIGLRELHPMAIAWVRTALGTLVLLPIAVLRVGGGEIVRSVRRAPWPILFVGIFQAALPPALIPYAERRLDSGLTGVLQAGAPLFAALLSARIARGDRVTGMRLAGLFLGFGGVAMLVGVQPRGDVLAALAAVLAGMTSGASAVTAGRWLAEARVEPLVTAFTTGVVATIALIPGIVLWAPHSMPGWKVTGSMLMLGVFGSGIAYLLYYAIIARSGASYGILVTYLVPVAALLYGSAVLSEPVTATSIAGLVLVLGGVGLGSGTLRLGRRGPPPVGG